MASNTEDIPISETTNNNAATMNTGGGTSTSNNTSGTTQQHPQQYQSSYQSSYQQTSSSNPAPSHSNDSASTSTTNSRPSSRASYAETYQHNRGYTTTPSNNNTNPTNNYEWTHPNQQQNSFRIPGTGNLFTSFYHSPYNPYPNNFNFNYEYGNILQSPRGNHNDQQGFTYNYRNSNHRTRNRIIIGAIVAFVLLYLSSSDPNSTRSNHYNRTNNNHSSTSNSNSNNNKGVAGDIHPVYSPSISTPTNVTPHISTTTTTTVADTNNYNNSNNDNHPNTNNNNINHPISTTTNNSNTDQYHPKIAYLVTYPMSGSNYILSLIKSTMNVNTATNYAFNAHHDLNSNTVFPIFHPSSTTTTSTTATTTTTTTTSKSNEYQYSTESKFDELPLPFWVDDIESTLSSSTSSSSTSTTTTTLLQPSNYIITNTHCGGYCLYPCTTSDYIQTASTFEENCRKVLLSSEHFDYFMDPSTNTNIAHDQHQNPTTIQNTLNDVYYTPRQYVGNKLIHFIRDPFANIVSRFHSYYTISTLEQAERSSTTTMATTSSLTKDDFHKWCMDMDHDANILEDELFTNLLPAELKSFLLLHMEQQVVEEIMDGHGQPIDEKGGKQTAINNDRYSTLPCHSEFIKYVLWHNSVFEMKNSSKLYENNMEQDHNQIEESNINNQITFMNIHFEDLEEESTRNAILERLSNFLDYDTSRLNLSSNTIPEFLKNKGSSSSYTLEYFNEEQKMNLEELVRILALRETWFSMRRYFHSGHEVEDTS